MHRIRIPFANRPSRRGLLLALFAVATTALSADDPPKAEPDASAAQAARNAPPPVPFNSGARPSEFGADRSKVTLEVRPNGMRIYHMNGQGMQAVVAHLGADGRMDFTCTDRVEQAAHADIGMPADNASEK